MLFCRSERLRSGSSVTRWASRRLPCALRAMTNSKTLAGSRSPSSRASSGSRASSSGRGSGSDMSSRRSAGAAGCRLLGPAQHRFGHVFAVKRQDRSIFRGVVQLLQPPFCQDAVGRVGRRTLGQVFVVLLRDVELGGGVAEFLVVLGGQGLPPHRDAVLGLAQALRAFLALL